MCTVALTENLVKMKCTGGKPNSIEVHCALTEFLVKMICTGRKLYHNVLNVYGSTGISSEREKP